MRRFGDNLAIIAIYSHLKLPISPWYMFFLYSFYSFSFYSSYSFSVYSFSFYSFSFYSFSFYSFSLYIHIFYSFSLYFFYMSAFSQHFSQKFEQSTYFFLFIFLYIFLFISLFLFFFSRYFNILIFSTKKRPSVGIREIVYVTPPVQLNPEDGPDCYLDDEHFCRCVRLSVYLSVIDYQNILWLYISIFLSFFMFFFIVLFCSVLFYFVFFSFFSSFFLFLSLFLLLFSIFLWNSLLCDLGFTVHILSPFLPSSSTSFSTSSSTFVSPSLSHINAVQEVRAYVLMSLSIFVSTELSDVITFF